MRLQGEKNRKGTRLHRQGEKRSYKGEVAHHCFCKLRRVGEKRRVCIGKKSNDVVGVNLHIIVCARSEESERNKDAMLQKEERGYKYKAIHQY